MSDNHHHLHHHQQPGNNTFEPIRPHRHQPQPPQQHQYQHELRRPDSVITTTSSIVSSEATDAETAPNDVYTISGLYGEKVKKASSMSRKRDSTPPVSLTSEVNSTTTTSTSQGPHSLGIVPLETRVKSSSLQPPGKQQQQQQQQQHHNHQQHQSRSHNRTHRRNTSHPGNFDVIPGVTCQRPNRGMVVVEDKNNGGHRRSNSYGPVHRALTGTASLNAADHIHLHYPHHRRTASSVIETLQTLACNGTEATRREDSIAQLLENLKKEQQEKIEKRELHEMQDELEDLRECGLGACRPKTLQTLANIKVFVLLLSMLVTLQQALASGYFNSVITTIEKRYEIPSSITGIIASMYEIGNVVTVIFVSYLGSRRHIPVWIGMGE